MSVPVPKSVAKEILDNLAPMLYADGDSPQNGALQIYVGGLSEPLFQEIEDYVSDDPTTGAIGYSAWVDINRAPDAALPWLAQFVGVKLSGGTAAQQRQQIKDLANFKRGTLAAMKTAAQNFLTGTKVVIIRERFGGAYLLNVVTYLSQTPVADWPATNLVENGSYETDIVGSTAGGAGSTVAQTSDWSHSGTSAIKLTITASGGQWINVLRRAGTRTPVVAGTTYTLSAYHKFGSGTPRNVDIGIDWIDAGGATISGPRSANVLLTDTNRATLTATAPVGAVTAILYGIVVATSVVGETFIVDDVQFEANTQATPVIPTSVGPVSRPAGQGPVGAALVSQKPAGIIMTYNVLTGQDYSLLLSGHATYALIYSSYATYAGIIQDAPGV